MSIQLTTGILQQIKNRGSSVPFLLDTYTGAAAAYSLRQLKTGVTSVVRVRRSSDNAEADFTATEVTDGTLTTWTGANDGFVVTWYDQSGNANNLTQATTTAQPQIVSAGSLIIENGKPIVLSAANKFMNFGTQFAANLTYWVFEAGKSAHNSCLDGLTNSNPLFRYVAESGSSNTVFMGVSTNIATYINGAPFTLTNRGVIYTQLAAHHVATHNYSSTTQTSRLGYNAQNTFPMRTSHEVIYYTTDQSANRAGIEADINAYYGIY